MIRTRRILTLKVTGAEKVTTAPKEALDSLHVSQQSSFPMRWQWLTQIAYLVRTANSATHLVFQTYLPKTASRAIIVRHLRSMRARTHAITTKSASQEHFTPKSALHQSTLLRQRLGLVLHVTLASAASVDL